MNIVRVKVFLKKNNRPVPVNCQNLLNSYFHRCVGKNNNAHDKPSDYSVSLLFGGIGNPDKETLEFPNGAMFYFSTFDMELFGKFVSGCMSGIDFGFGMEFDTFEHLREPFYDGFNNFFPISPILLRRDVEPGKYEFITVHNPEFASVLKERTAIKLKAISKKQNLNLNLSEFDLTVWNNESNHVKTVVVITKDKQNREVKVINKASFCQVKIKCNKQIAQILYAVGLGQSTGSGFGTISNKKNYEIHRNEKTAHKPIKSLQTSEF